MSVTEETGLHERASMLVRQLIDDHDPKFGVGSMTCSLYDTAWVSMVAKTTGDQRKWLFPSCFHYLLSQQQHDGGWATSGSDSDAILNTMAGLLAMCKHLSAPAQLTYISAEELQYKKDHAIYFLEAKFSQWDIASRKSANFEILATKLLELLEREGIDFAFSGRELLFQKREKAIAKFNPTSLFTNRRSLHTQSLEALIGEIDFNHLSHHTVSGSMMASPASTAAYLMNCSKWDDEAEAYLSHVVNVGGETCRGSVPSRFPSTTFEIAATLSLLLEGGFKATDLSITHLDNATGFLEDCLALDSGVTGFAPYVEPDADNTARTISVLHLLGRTPSAQGLTDRYATRHYFKTYMHHRNPSFRTNCLVLKALLDSNSKGDDVISHIESTTRFIANCWWTTNGQIEDNMNSSSHYTTMLMTQAFIRLVDLDDQKYMPVLDDLVLRDKILICLFQALVRTLQTQNRDGSWGRGLRSETTSYALLTLSKLSTLSSAPRVRSQAAQAIEHARVYLHKSLQSSYEPDHVWTEKTASGYYTASQAFVLAALQATTAILPSSRAIEQRFGVPLAKVAIQTKYFSKQPWFANMPEWQVQAFLVESHLFLPQLKAVQFAVFPSESMTQDEYFDSIPLGWIAAGSIEGRFIGAEYLYQMMILTFLNRQLVEYVQRVLSETFSGCLFEVEDLIHNILAELEEFDFKDQCFCDGHAPRSSISTSGTTSLAEARSVLYRYISHILNHPYALMASHHDQGQLRSELLAFLLGSLSTASENKEPSGIEDDALAQTTGTSSPDQTAHQLTFTFLSCMVGNQEPNGSLGLRRDFLATPDQHYLVADLCRRLSILSFLSQSCPDGEGPEAPFRELGSSYRPFSLSNYKRDSMESSLSSASLTSSSYSDVDSPVSPISSVSSAPSKSPTREFDQKYATETRSEPTLKRSDHSIQLQRLLRHERKCLDICIESLCEAGTSLRTMSVLKLFVDFSELGDQIFNDSNIGSSYIDVANRTAEILKKTNGAGTENRPPTPPKKAQRRGSVTAARAALEIAPLKPRHDSRNPDPSSESYSHCEVDASSPPHTTATTETASLTTEDEIKLRGTTSTQREWNHNKQNKMLRNPKAIRSSIEISRIERVMASIDGGKIADGPLPPLPPLPPSTPKKADELPTPKINPMLPVHPAFRPVQIGGEQVQCDDEGVRQRIHKNQHELLPKEKPEAQPRPSFTSTVTSFKTVRGRKGSFSGSLSGSFASKKSNEEKLLARLREDERKRRVAMDFQFNHSALYAKPGKPAKSKPTEASKGKRGVRLGKAMTGSTAVKVEDSPLVPRKTNISEKDDPPEKKGEQDKVKQEPVGHATGCISPPIFAKDRAAVSLEAQRLERMNDLKRASRLGGPRWRAPF